MTDDTPGTPGTLITVLSDKPSRVRYYFCLGHLHTPEKLEDVEYRMAPLAHFTGRDDLNAAVLKSPDVLELLAAQAMDAWVFDIQDTVWYRWTLDGETPRWTAKAPATFRLCARDVAAHCRCGPCQGVTRETPIWAFTATLHVRRPPKKRKLRATTHQTVKRRSKTTTTSTTPPSP